MRLDFEIPDSQSIGILPPQPAIKQHNLAPRNIVAKPEPPRPPPVPTAFRRSRPYPMSNSHLPRMALFPNQGKDYDENEARTMANVQTELEIDWTACELIERVPGKVSGRPVVRGTRILPDAIVGSYDLGETIDELREGFPSLSVSQIERLIEFAHAQRAQANQ